MFRERVWLRILSAIHGLPPTCWLLDMPLRSTRGPDYDFTTRLVGCSDRTLGYCPPERATTRPSTSWLRNRGRGGAVIGAMPIACGRSLDSKAFV